MCVCIDVYIDMYIDLNDETVYKNLLNFTKFNKRSLKAIYKNLANYAKHEIKNFKINQ